jgi:hypothetical protein
MSTTGTPAPTAATTAPVAPNAATTASVFTLGGRSYTPRAITNLKIISDVMDEVLHKKDARVTLTAND